MTQADRHDEVVELLPWYVNGTLSEREHGRVERHVHACLTCYSALQGERRLQSLVAGGPAEPLGAEQGFEALMARAERGRGAPRGRAGRAARRYGPAAVAAVAAAAVLALAVLVGSGLWRSPIPAQGEYETASTPRPDAAELDIVFAEGLGEEEMRALLRDIGARIVSGPTQLGRYTVRLETSVSEDELAEIVARLMQDKRVRFAGRSYIGGAQ